ncbi:MAG: hypothetical protein GQ570_04765 [Helicobacteraceae bacterium]|nr:hypothetical protein [Helicobacteraceae bacterium]
MRIKFKFVIYNEEDKTFKKDDKDYFFEFNTDEEQFEEIKNKELVFYNWFKESEVFTTWLNKEVYPNLTGQKVAITKIDTVNYLRFYFFKENALEHNYEYFMELFGIDEDIEWQDRENTYSMIMEHLGLQQQEMLIELVQDKSENINEADLVEAE